MPMIAITTNSSTRVNPFRLQDLIIKHPMVFFLKYSANETSEESSPEYHACTLMAGPTHEASTTTHYQQYECTRLRHG